MIFIEYLSYTNFITVALGDCPLLGVRSRVHTRARPIQGRGPPAVPAARAARGVAARHDRLHSLPQARRAGGALSCGDRVHDDAGVPRGGGGAEHVRDDLQASARGRRVPPRPRRLRRRPADDLRPHLLRRRRRRVDPEVRAARVRRGGGRPVAVPRGVGPPHRRARRARAQRGPPRREHPRRRGRRIGAHRPRPLPPGVPRRPILRVAPLAPGIDTKYSVV
ncbi:hypothetical protein QJS04_geneDACA003641 [Acorus gramineus]|uniref:Uncharacterized protein n=1 Tax=Acorus gramineus TaxID=55184 RepID=A0AAV9BNL4_ACOGR|nr:hypothetical protein QJS04_geneDACA003641 [Acorus gramineus]